MPKTYEYSIGSVRARERLLLNKADLETMLSFGSQDELVGFLRDKGYGEGDTAEEIIRSSRKAVYAYLEKILPDVSILDVFLYPADIHNIKCVIKGLLSSSEYKNMLVSPCTLDFELIEKAVKENKFDLLGETFAEAAKNAYETLASSSDARTADAFLDKACMIKQLEDAKKSKTDFLPEYFTADVFYKNIKIALRAAKTSSREEYYYDSLVDNVGPFDVKKTVKAAMNGTQELVSYFSKLNAFSCDKAMECFSSSPSEFERFVDNYLVALARKRCKTAGTGADAALGYFVARQNEEKAIHIISAGIDSAMDRASIRERLRESYA